MLHSTIKYLTFVSALACARPHDDIASSPAPLTRRAIWQPAAGTAFQIVLAKPISVNANSPAFTPNVPVVDIDMFAHSDGAVIKSLHQLGKKVICYFSAGSYEPGRPDSDQIPAEAKGDQMQGWDQEYWLDTRNEEVRRIMSDRIYTAWAAGCDAIDPDNMDGYRNDHTFGLTTDDAIDYFRYLVSQAEYYSLAVGLKNAIEIAADVVNDAHFVVNESCVLYNECGNAGYKAFIAAGKPVFHIEYEKVTIANACASSKGVAGFSTVKKYTSLDGWVQYCDKKTYTTKTVG